MRGSPWIQTLAVTLALLALFLPLRRMTSHPRPAASATVPTTAAAVEKIVIQLDFAHAPTRFDLQGLGKSVWKQEGAGTHAEKELEIAYPPEGIDLVLDAEWPGGTPETAVRVTVQRRDGSQQQQTLWGKESLSDTVSFK